MPAQRIKLGDESSETIFVDDVDVSKGMYGINEKKTSGFVFTEYTTGNFYWRGSGFTQADYSWEAYVHLTEFISKMRNDYGVEIYTIPENRRITTEKELTIEYLKNTDHVGFVSNEGEKFFIIKNCNDKYELVSGSPTGIACNNSWGNYEGHSIANALEYANVADCYYIIEVLRFDTRKELYQWLSE